MRCWPDRGSLSTFHLLLEIPAISLHRQRCYRTSPFKKNRGEESFKMVSQLNKLKIHKIINYNMWICCCLLLLLSHCCHLPMVQWKASTCFTLAMILGNSRPFLDHWLCNFQIKTVWIKMKSDVSIKTTFQLNLFFYKHISKKDFVSTQYSFRRWVGWFCKCQCIVKAYCNNL